MADIPPRSFEDSSLLTRARADLWPTADESLIKLGSTASLLSQSSLNSIGSLFSDRVHEWVTEIQQELQQSASIPPPPPPSTSLPRSNSSFARPPPQATMSGDPSTTKTLNNSTASNSTSLATSKSPIFQNLPWATASLSSPSPLSPSQGRNAPHRMMMGMSLPRCNTESPQRQDSFGRSISGCHSLGPSWDGKTPLGSPSFTPSMAPTPQLQSASSAVATPTSSQTPQQPPGSNVVFVPIMVPMLVTSSQPGPSSNQPSATQSIPPPPQPPLAPQPPIGLPPPPPPPPPYLPPFPPMMLPTPPPNGIFLPGPPQQPFPPSFHQRFLEEQKRAHRQPHSKPAVYTSVVVTSPRSGLDFRRTSSAIVTCNSNLLESGDKTKPTSEEDKEDTEDKPEGAASGTAEESKATAPFVSGPPCNHQSQWKCLRVKKGIQHLLCRRCGVKWKSQNFLGGLNNNHASRLNPNLNLGGEHSTSSSSPPPAMPFSLMPTPTTLLVTHSQYPLGAL